MENAMSDEREGTIRSVLSEARDQTADVADQVRPPPRICTGRREIVRRRSPMLLEEA